jgi:hypothetical protein
VKSSRGGGGGGGDDVSVLKGSFELVERGGVLDGGGEVGEGLVVGEGLDDGAQDLSGAGLGQSIDEHYPLQGRYTTNLQIKKRNKQKEKKGKGKGK